MAGVTLAVTGLPIHFDVEEVFNARKPGSHASAGSTVCDIRNAVRGSISGNPTVS